MGKALILHMVELGLTPGTTYGSLSPTRRDPLNPEPGASYVHPGVVPKGQQQISIYYLKYLGVRKPPCRDSRGKGTVLPFPTSKYFLEI